MKEVTIFLLLLICVNVVFSSDEKHEASTLDGALFAGMDELTKKNLRTRKRRGILRKREISLASVLFPKAGPKNFENNDDVPMTIETVTSLQSNLAYDYYKLPVCPPLSAGKRKKTRKNFGEKLKGNVSRPAPYEIRVGKNLGCQALCQVEIDKKKLDFVIKLTRERYRANLSLDNLPVYIRQHKGLNIINKGYPIGVKLQTTDDVKYYLNNHLKFVIYYHEDAESFAGKRIVGFEVKPISIAHETDTEEPSTCTDAKDIQNKRGSVLELKLPSDQDALKVIYSYEVAWEVSDTTWADRWDIYVGSSLDETSLQHVRIVNSLAVIFGLILAGSFIFVRMLRKELHEYVGDDMESETAEEKGWKLLHGDIFRPPSFNPMILSVLVGNGFQIFIVIVTTLTLCSLRIINPMKKGQALGTIVMLYFISGSCCGYVSARFFKLFGGSDWKLNTVYSAAALPGFLMSLFLVLNIFLSIAGATHVSFWTILQIFLLWVCMLIPLVFFGSYMGFKAERIAIPCKVNQIARVVPERSVIQNSALSSFVIGLMAFSSLTVEIYMLMNALWLQEFFYAVGYLFFVIIVFTISCSLLAMIACYYRMNKENHRWWWYAFNDTAFSGLWIIVYSGWFLFTEIDYVGGLPFIVYWTYMTMIAVLMALFAGAAGFIPTFFFIRKIYSTLKVD